MFPLAYSTLHKAGGVRAFLDAFRASPVMRGAWVPALEMVALAHFYSPNPDAADGVDLPFDLATGARDDGVFERWRAHDPVVRVAGAAEALGAMRLVLLECGRHDEYHLHLGLRMLAGALTSLGISHEHSEFDGGHRHTRYRYAHSIPRLARTLTP